jgi:membrane fusion protein, heavy metal efflux system
VINRRSLLAAASAGIAAAAGFAAGHSGSVAASTTAPRTATPAATPADPPLPAAITVSGQELENLQLHVAKAESAPLVRTVLANGTVGYDELHLARITPPARGRIETLDVVVGDRVTAGQRLAVLDNFELSTVRSKVASAEAAVAQAKAQLATAQAALARAANLVRAGGMAQSELDARHAMAASMEADLRTREAELAQYQEERARLMPMTGLSSDANAGASTGAGPVVDEGPLDSRGAIVAPFKGTVDSVSASPGEIIDPSTQIFTVADLSTVWVQLDVPESGLGNVQIGDAVQVRASAYPGRVFPGRVIYISDKIEPATGTAKVRCAVPNPDGALRVNMFATASIVSPLGRAGILVPSSALQDVNGQSVVFIPTGQGQFAWRAVQAGLVSDDQTQITSGLAAGTPVISEGSYWLKAALMQSTIPDEG